MCEMKILSTEPIVDLERGFATFDKILFNGNSYKVIACSKIIDQCFVSSLNHIGFIYYYELNEYV